MSRFQDVWIAEAARLIGSELAQPVEIAAAAAEGSLTGESLLSVVAEVGGAWKGRFTVSVAESLLAALMAQAGDIAAEQGVDHETWRSLFARVAQAAAQALSRQGGAVEIVSVAFAPVPPEGSSSLLELYCGSLHGALHLADQVQPVGAEPASAQAEAPAARPAEPTAPPAVPTASPEKRFSRPPEPPDPPSAPAARAEEPVISARGLDLLLDVELEASLRFGSREMPLNQILELGPGDVVQLDRHVADPVDLIVGDKIVARGEVVLVNGNFGLRVTEVAEPRKSLESIRCLF